MYPPVPGCGALAQLVERLVRNEKVRSSSLLCSTRLLDLIVFLIGFLLKPNFFNYLDILFSLSSTMVFVFPWILVSLFRLDRTSIILLF